MELESAQKIMQVEADGNAHAQLWWTQPLQCENDLWSLAYNLLRRAINYKVLKYI